MSDHFDGPRMIVDPVIDLTDLYAFPSPEQMGRLVLVMNVFPMAGKSACFSDSVAYKFRIRRATLGTPGKTPAFTLEEQEYDFTFTFSAPVKAEEGDHLIQQGCCITPTGESVTLEVNDEQGAEIEGLRLFAGLRLDPFFVDAKAILTTIQTRKLAFQSTGKNALEGANVLSIVMDMDVATIFGDEGSPLLAVVAETKTVGSLPVRLGRLGRPEVKNFGLGAKHVDPVNRDLEIRDLYNQEDSFKLASHYLGAYRARLNANLADWDSYDGKIDLPFKSPANHPLTDLLLADYLVVDTSKPFAEDGYFEIEQSFLNGKRHQTCGGRWLNDDIVDTVITLYINGGKGPRIRDGVDQAGEPACMAFPYLQPPNPNPPGRSGLLTGG
jgi:hypothetical protein